MKVLIFKDIKNKRWTLWNLNRSIHLGYVDEIFLMNCKMVVLEEKRKKILKTKKRFPHAFILGSICKKKLIGLNKEIKYNPFVDKNFKIGNKKVLSRKMVLFTKNGKCFSK